jgi:hypothetical protein
VKLGLGFLLAYGAAANRLAPVYWFAMGDYAFFLGGYDLEMVAIKDLLSQHSRAPVHDRHFARTGFSIAGVAATIVDARAGVGRRE